MAIEYKTVTILIGMVQGERGKATVIGSYVGELDALVLSAAIIGC